MPLDNDLVEALPTGYRINGVAHYCQNSKPTGSGIVAGDRWYKPVDGSDWYWSGSDWLSTETYTIKSDYNETNYAASLTMSGGVLQGKLLSTGRGGLFFVSATTFYYSSAATTATDYWKFDHRVLYSDGTSEVIASTLGQNQPANFWNKAEVVINSKKNSGNKTFALTYTQVYKIGTPLSIYAMTEIEYKYVHP